MTEPYLPPQDSGTYPYQATTPDDIENLVKGAEPMWTGTAGEYTGDFTDGLHVKYQLVQGTRVMRPQAQGPGELVRLHADYYAKVVLFSYERTGEWPLCPSPFLNNPNEHLRRAEITLASPRVVDDVRVFRVDGLYVFELLKGLDGSGVITWGPFSVGTTPESKASLTDNTMPVKYFDPSALGVGFHKLL